MTADKTYHATADGRLVPEGHPEGVAQIARAGCHVDDAVVTKYGLPRDFDAEPAEKAVATAENKAVKAKETK